MATEKRPLSGALTEVVLDDGRTVMAKRTDSLEEARAEAAGLRWLAGAGTVRVPIVYGQDGHWLVTDLIARGRPNREAALDLGRALAGLHLAGAPAFGSAPPGGPRARASGGAPV